MHKLYIERQTCSMPSPKRKKDQGFATVGNAPPCGPKTEAKGPTWGSRVEEYPVERYELYLLLFWLWPISVFPGSTQMYTICQGLLNTVSPKAKDRKEDLQTVRCLIHNANKPNITLNCPLLTAAFNYAASLEEQQVAVTKLHSKKLIWWNSELQKCDVDVKPPFLFVVTSFTLNTWKLFRCTVCNYYRYFFMIMWLELNFLRKHINILVTAQL